MQALRRNEGAEARPVVDLCGTGKVLGVDSQPLHTARGTRKAELEMPSRKAELEYLLDDSLGSSGQAA
jgi:hypothetical protein